MSKFLHTKQTGNIRGFEIIPEHDLSPLILLNIEHPEIVHVLSYGQVESTSSAVVTGN